MQIILIPVTELQQNSSLLICKDTRKAVIIDPGGDLYAIDREVKKQNIKIEKILLTHGHFDHCGYAKICSEYYKVLIEGPHKDELFWFHKLPEQGLRFGNDSISFFKPDIWLYDNNIIKFGNKELIVYHCPGHTPGHIVFFNRKYKLAIVGDVIFHGSIGRTDFPKSNYNDLISSIRNKLFPLGDDVVFIPGHGQMSTFGKERKNNPYVSDKVVGKQNCE